VNTAYSYICNISGICIAGSLPLTTLSFHHSLFNEKCASSSLDCPYNTANGQQIRPRPPVNLPVPMEEPSTTQKPPPPPPPPPTHKSPVEEISKFNI
jgi:hypothetical protein